MVRFILLAIVLLIAPAALAAPDCGLYRYRAVITDVYDGDTVTADIDLGFNTWRRGERLRLEGIDTPEVRGDERPAGLVARDALRALVLGREVTVCTLADRRGRDMQGKYGRYLVRIYLDAPSQGVAPGTDVNAWLVRHDLAEPYAP